MTVDAGTGETVQELTSLRQRVAELERLLEEQSRAAEERMRHQLIAIEASLDGIAILDAQGIYRYMNKPHATIHGFDRPEELIGQSWSVVVPDDMLDWYQQECMPQLWREGHWFGEVMSKRRDGSLHPTIIALTAIEGGGMVCVVRDVTDEKQAEAERLRLQEQIISTQAAALAELSTPLIPISDEVVVMPLIGSIDSRRAQQVLETLLDGVAESKARVAIVDITGVAVVDTQVANALIRAAQAVQLLGARTILTGIRPEVAQTLVGLGTDMRGVITRGTLQSGIAYAINNGKSDAG